jgi:hypothetical protein
MLPGCGTEGEGIATLRPRCIELLAVAGCLVGILSCAQQALLRPRQVDQVPSGKYSITVSEDQSGGRQYNAVLFETAAAPVRLDLPRVIRRGMAEPDDYPAVLKAGFVVYELSSAAGDVAGYLVVPQRAQVMVWDQGAAGGGIVVTVTGLPNAPESGSGGSGSGM